MIPANISLMKLTPNRLALLKPVTSLDIFEGSNQKNFHEDGLFSTTIFGRVQSEQRDVRFSYIDIKVPVFHPLMYRNLVKLKGLYGGILTGKAYAKWDSEKKDFLPSDELQGDTGYSFFFKHWMDIDFKLNTSDTRKLKVDFIEKYKSDAVVTKVLVIPAGLRDLHVDATGRQKEDEINSLYRQLLSLSNTITNDVDYTSSILDVTRCAIQLKFNEIFDHIQNLLDGKHGFLQQKWASRKVFNSTRNVITAMDTSTAVLGEPNGPKLNNTVIGIYQMAKAALPITKYELRNGWLGSVFGAKDAQVMLTDIKTRKAVPVFLQPETIDRWSTNDGLEKVINGLSNPSARAKPIVIEDRYYLGLIYLGKDGTYKVFNDIDQLPSDKDPNDVYPLTLVEWMYISCWQRWHTLVGYLTRYPITGQGSTYPSYPYVKTTVRSVPRKALDDNWEVDTSVPIAYEFPMRGLEEYVESLAPHSTSLRGLAGDFS